MSVEVRLPTILRPHAGGESTVDAEGSTIGEVFSTLTDRYPGMKGQLLGDDGQIRKFVNVYKNDEDVRYLQALDTPVTEGDVISILPAVAGGV